MARLLKQSSTAQPLLFLLVQSADHITPLTGASPTVTLSKAGAAFGSPAGAVTEVANGWYKVAGNATDTDTLGVLILHATATSGDPADVVFEIVSFDPQDAAALGLSRIDAAVTTRLAPTTAGRTLDVSATGEAGVDWANVGSPTTSLNLSATTISTSQAVASVSGAVGSVTGAVGSVTGNVGGNVVGSVGSVASGGIAAASFAAGAINAAAIATDAIDADALAADAVTEIQSGLATAAALSTVAGYVDTEVAAILAAVDTEVAAIKAKTDNLPTDPADASDIAASFAAITSTLSTIASYIDTEVAAIKAKTDNLPADPADASDIAASFSTVSSTLTTIASYIDTEVAAIKAKTDLIPASPAAVGDIPTAAAISDVVWDELMAGHVIAASAGAYMAAAGAAADPLLNTVPGSYASGTAGAALGRIGTADITVVSPVSSGGDLTVNRGDSYTDSAVDWGTLSWTETTGAWQKYVGKTARFAAMHVNGTTFSKAVTVTDVNGTTAKVTLSLTSAETGAFVTGSWAFEVQVVAATGKDVTPLRAGTMTVLADIAAAS